MDNGHNQWELGGENKRARLDSKWRRAKFRLLMEVIEWEEEKVMSKEGWPQLGKEEEGKERDEVKGRHEHLGVVVSTSHWF